MLTCEIEHLVELNYYRVQTPKTRLSPLPHPPEVLPFALCTLNFELKVRGRGLQSVLTLKDILRNFKRSTQQIKKIVAHRHFMALIVAIPRVSVDSMVRSQLVYH